MVEPTRGTSIRCFLASSTPLRMASVYSAALPRPMPTWPLRSPTTTMARMLKRRPPLTTLETRRTCTTVSSRFSFDASILGIFSPRGLKFQADFTSAFCKRSHAPMIGVATTIKDDPTDTFFFRALPNQLANFARQSHFVIVRDGGQGLYRRLLLALLRAGQYSLALRTRSATLALRPLLRLSASGWSLLCLRPFALRRRSRGSQFRLGDPFFYLSHFRLHCRGFLFRRFEVAQRRVQRRGGCQRLARRVVDDLSIDMVAAAEDVQARTSSAAFQAISQAVMPLETRFICVKFLNHFFLPPTFPAFPALRRTASPA